jgi:transposase
MRNRQKLLTDQGELIEPLFPRPRPRKDNRGRPWASIRACLEGILWVLQTGAAWRLLPAEYPSPSTCWRRLKQWERTGGWLRAWRTLLGVLDAEGLLRWDGAFLDGSFAPAKKGAPPSAKPSGKGTKSMVLGDGQGIPLGILLESASPAEVTLPDATRKEVRVPRPKGRPRQKPKRVIADRGYDSDPLRKRWKKRGVELISPYRNNNKQRRYHDGRKLRRYKRRWIIERTNVLEALNSRTSEILSDWKPTLVSGGQPVNGKSAAPKRRNVNLARGLDQNGPNEVLKEGVSA